VALVKDGEGYAVHRTWLRPDGTGKARIEPDKAMMGQHLAALCAFLPGRSSWL
jgi:hypothetical protein